MKSTYSCTVFRQKRGQNNSDYNETVIVVYLESLTKWSSLVDCQELNENGKEKKWPEVYKLQK